MSTTSPSATSKKSGFDLATAPNLAAREEEGLVVHLRDECEELMYDGDAPVTVTVVGEYSATYQKAQAEIQRANIKAARIDPDAIFENAESNAIKLCAACVKGWSGFKNGDAEFPCTRANAETLLKAAPHIRKQLERAIMDHARFFKAS